MASTSAPIAPRSYRKKPVVIQAMQWDGSEESQRRLVNWGAGNVSGWFGHEGRSDMKARYYLMVDTLEGEMRLESGDWLIRGIKGEFYPCKPDIFEATYEPTSAIPAFIAAQRPELGTKNYSIDATGREGGKASTETRS